MQVISRKHAIAENGRMVHVLNGTTNIPKKGKPGCKKLNYNVKNLFSRIALKFKIFGARIGSQNKSCYVLRNRLYLHYDRQYSA